MIEEQTVLKMREMKLHGLAEAYSEIIADPPGNGLSFAEKIAMMIDRESTQRDNRRLARLLRAAKLGLDACLEDVWCDAGRGISKDRVRELATCRWIKHRHNIVIVGKTGCGKSYLGAALAQAACRNGHKALRARVPRLLHELAIARADGSYRKRLEKLARTQVLVLDDFLIAPLKNSERNDLLEILEDRYDKSSTVITSQVPTKTWHEQLADPTIADAICDRLIHNAHVLSLRGPSMRKKKGLGKN